MPQSFFFFTMIAAAGMMQATRPSATAEPQPLFSLLPAVVVSLGAAVVVSLGAVVESSGAGVVVSLGAGVVVSLGAAVVVSAGVVSSAAAYAALRSEIIFLPASDSGATTMLS